ncbi:MAG: aminotransferase class V-fold PLP-dependent enzyme [Promethearchaeota archaeon]|nr:MAG: aminotransferase class V-fold PLP-dependent enzyme [Candidatus Lokiarchaeota archaeon]
MPIEWEQIRNNYFPAMNSHTYLMAASASPMNKIAYKEGLNYLNTMLNHGDIYYEQFKEHVDKNRETIAQYINCNPEQVAFVPNVSAGMNIVARLLDKEEFIYPSIEFPASVHIFKRLGFPSRKIEPTKNKYLIKNITKVKSKSTKILIHSHVQSLNGFRQNLTKLGAYCKENGLISVINSTQSFGSFEIDVKRDNIDIMISNTLKWVGSGYGAGVLYINQDLLNEKEIPISGWLSVLDPFEMNNENLDVINHPQSMDTFGGCPNYGALLALRGSFNLIMEKIGLGDVRNGIRRIQERILWLTEIFLDKIKNFNFNIISPLEPEFRSGIITIEHQKAEKIYNSLIKNNIYITLKKYPTAKKNTLLRFSFNYYNNEDDIEKVVRILYDLEY